MGKKTIMSDQERLDRARKIEEDINQAVEWLGKLLSETDPRWSNQIRDLHEAGCLLSYTGQALRRTINELIYLASEEGSTVADRRR